MLRWGLCLSLFVAAFTATTLLVLGAEQTEVTELTCPVSGQACTDGPTLRYKNASLRFCSDDCRKRFKDNSKDFYVRANQQLVLSGQARQTKCPFTGKGLKDSTEIQIAGSQVRFCCSDCRDKVTKADADEQPRLIFDNKPFRKGFVVETQSRASAGKKTSKATPSNPSAAQPGTGTIDEQAVAIAIRIQERYTERLLSTTGILGTGIVEGKNNQPVIQVYLASADQAVDVPAQLDGIPVQTEVIGTCRAIGGITSGPDHLQAEALKPEPMQYAKPTGTTQVSPSAWNARPVPIGVSTGNQGKCSAGSIACRLKDAAGNYYALSNNHIFALENKAILDSAVVQPGRADTGSCAFLSDNQIGTLAVYKLIFFGGVNNVVDAALARTTVAQLGRDTPADGYGTPGKKSVTATLGMPVQKYGQTTAMKKGTVTAVNVIMNVNYSSGTAKFVRQIIVTGTDFIGPGDSGSLLVRSSDNAPVGLLFAQLSSRNGVANPIGDVLAEFQKTIPTLQIDGK